MGNSARRIVALTLAALSGVAWGGEEPAKEVSAPRLAGEFTAAWRAKDAARAAALAAEPAVDPFAVADVLLRIHAAARAATPPETVDALEAAAAYAALVARRSDGEGVTDVVGRGRALDDAGAAREHDLRMRFGALEAAMASGRLAEAVTKASEIAAALPAEASVLGGSVHLRGGEALLALGRVDEAVRSAERARAIGRTLRWTRMEAHALVLTLRAKEKAEEPRATIAVADELLPRLERLGWTVELGEARAARAAALNDTGRFAEALADAEKELAPAPGSRGARSRATALEGMGLALERLGRTKEAIEAFGRASAAHREGEDPRGGPATARHVARVLEREGRTAEAAALLADARKEAERLGAPDLADGAADDLASLLHRTGRSDEAFALQDAAVAHAREKGQRPVLGPLLRRMGRAHLGVSQPQRALALFEEAMEIDRARGDAVSQASLRVDLAEACVRLGKLDEAELHAKAAPSIEDARFPPKRRWESAQVRAAVLEALGKREEAKALAERVLAERARTGSDDDATLHRLLGRLALARGDAEEAGKAALRALALRASRPRGFAEEATAWRDRARADADLGLEAAIALQRAAPEKAPAAAALALECTERTRAAWLAEALAEGRGPALPGLDGALVEREAGAAQRVREARRRLVASVFRRPPDAAAEASARRDLEAAQGDLADARRGMGRAVRRLSDVVAPEPATVEGVRALFGPKTAYVAYHVTPREVLAVVVAPRGTALLALGPAEEARTAATSWQRALSGGELNDAPFARRMHALLGTPLEPLLEGTERIVVSPDDAFSFVPFDAMLSGEGGTAKRWIERWEVTYTPSATVSALLGEDTARSVSGARVLCLGDPVYPGEAPPGTAKEAGSVPGSLDRLPWTGDEVRAIAKRVGAERTVTLLREEATLARLREALARAPKKWRAVHLACRGLVDPAHPMSSGLVLGGGEVLGPAALLRSRVDADVAVLSACETGRGRLERGEGVVGLVRGFFAAGTPRVVVSQWRVADDESRRVMEAFHGALAAGSATPAEALRRAKLERLRAGGKSARPHTWAAWGLWGRRD